MSSPVDIGVYEEQKTKKKGVREHYWGCRCCDPSPDCSLKMNHIGYKIICISQYATQLLTNKDHSDVSESENWIKTQHSVGDIELTQQTI